MTRFLSSKVSRLPRRLAKGRACVLAGLLALCAASASAAPSVYPTGVTRHDPARADNSSYVLFTGQDKRTHLIDLNGNEVRQWPYEGFPPVLLDPAVTGGKLGHVLVQLSRQLDGPAAANALAPQSLGEVDWNGQVVWRWSGAQAQQAYGSPDGAAAAGPAVRQHNDWRRLPNGNTAVLVSYAHPVAGFAADKVIDDAIYEVSPQGEVVWRWVASEHLEEFGFSDASLKLIRGTLARNNKSAPFDYLHLNNLSVLGSNRWFDAGDARFHPDNLLIGSRTANFMAIIERKTGRVVWHLGPDFAPSAPAGAKLPRPVDQLIGQHDGHIIAKGLPGAGHLLVFDNQGEAGYPIVSPGLQPRSRILEIDPVKKEIVWQYTGADSGAPAWSFYSSFISSARRLPNGNTLIDEGTSGRLFQVTPGGEIVWEYISPYFGEVRNGGEGKTVLSNWIYRAQPVPHGWVPTGAPLVGQAVKAIDVRTFRLPAQP
ncbi:arylsulfotransferase family protein [Polaromonas hydrogenivorans]|uniref:Arylsulfotransferase family protein n=1 Tax=Polaromonas hydrogenivorans TaxID=335476 RepID=A0AAU7LSX1_9BURK